MYFNVWFVGVKVYSVGFEYVFCVVCRIGFGCCIFLFMFFFVFVCSIISNISSREILWSFEVLWSLIEVDDDFVGFVVVIIVVIVFEF